MTVYMCHPTVPSMTDSWLFSRPWSGFGGSGGGVFICLMSDSSTAPAEVRWQEKKKTDKLDRSDPLTTEVTILRWCVRKIFNFGIWHVTFSCILYFGDLDSVSRCPWLSPASACQSLVSGTEAEHGSLFSYRASPCSWCHMTNRVSASEL